VDPKFLTYICKSEASPDIFAKFGDDWPTDLPRLCGAKRRLKNERNITSKI